MQKMSCDVFIIQFLNGKQKNPTEIYAVEVFGEDVFPSYRKIRITPQFDEEHTGRPRNYRPF